MNVKAILEDKGHDVLTIGPNETLAQAIAVLAERRIGALVVTNGTRKVIGILSERDIVRALAAHGASALGRTVGSVMSTDVVTCACGDSVDALMASMTERRIRHLPVVDDERAVIGIVSIGDVVKARLGQLEHENQALTEYIHQGL